MNFWLFIVFCILIIKYSWSQEPVIRPIDTYINLDTDFGAYKEAGEDKFYDSIPFPVLDKYHMLMSPSWYLYQARVWKRELDGQKTSDEAWFYMFRAFQLAGKTKAADSIVDLVNMKYSGSWVSKALKWYESKPSARNYNNFEKIFLEAPPAIQVHLYSDLVNAYEATCRSKDRDSVIQNWLLSGEWPMELIYYGYNLLQTTPNKAILFSEGPFESTALFLAQKKGLRPDVVVANLELLSYFPYRKCLSQRWEISIPEPISDNSGVAVSQIVDANPDKIFYITLSTAKTIFKYLKSQIFCEGLAYRIKKPSYSTFYKLLDNLENNYNLLYLNDSLSVNIFNRFRAHQFNMVYVPPILQLFDLYYYRDEPEKADKWFKIALNIAQKAGNADLVYTHKLFWNRDGKESERFNKRGR